jgi:hypothetical protein
MSDLTASRAPSPAISQTVIDALGRTLTIREIGPMEQIDLFEAAGDQSNNSPWVGMAILAASVTDIDGIPMPTPRSKNTIRAALKTLGSEGVAAVAKALRPSAPDEDADVVAIAKN